MMVFLDNAATTFHKPSAVYRAVGATLKECSSVGRGGYPAAQLADRRGYETRAAVASLYNIDDPSAVIFTYNATVALNMAIKGLAKPGRVLISGYEHNAVVRPLESLVRHGTEYSVAGSALFDPDAMLAAFRGAIRSDTVLVVCNHVSNVFGSIAPIMEIDEFCAERGLPLIIDASQSAGTIVIDTKKLRAAEFICMPGHKGLYGPQGTGVMLHVGERECSTIIEGGTGSNSALLEQPSFEPDKFESGTHNVAGIAGLGEGVRFILRETPVKILAHERDLTAYAASELKKLPDVTVCHSDDPNLQAGVLSFTVHGRECEDVAATLATAGIAVRAGLHCAPIAHRSAGTFPGGTVRVSPGHFSTHRDIEKLITAVRVL